MGSSVRSFPAHFWRNSVTLHQYRRWKCSWAVVESPWGHWLGHPRVFSTGMYLHSQLVSEKNSLLSPISEDFMCAVITWSTQMTWVTDCSLHPTTQGDIKTCYLSAGVYYVPGTNLSSFHVFPYVILRMTLLDGQEMTSPLYEVLVFFANGPHLV